MRFGMGGTGHGAHNHHMQADHPHRERGRPAEALAPRLPSLDEILALVPDAVCVVDVEGRYLFVNAGFEPGDEGRIEHQLLDLTRK